MAQVGLMPIHLTGKYTTRRASRAHGELVTQSTI